MKIKLDLSVFLFLSIFILTNQIELYVLLMSFAFIHEFAHLICGVILGFKPSLLKIIPLGFCVEFETGIQAYNKKVKKSNTKAVKECIIALAGPIVNLIIVILGIIFKIDNNIIYSNFLIAIFNLIPIYPLDGGRILNNLLKIFCGNRKAHKYTNFIANFLFILLTMLSSILILIYQNISILAIIIGLWCIIIKENTRYNTYNKIYKVIDKDCK